MKRVADFQHQLHQLEVNRLSKKPIDQSYWSEKLVLFEDKALRLKKFQILHAT